MRSFSSFTHRQRPGAPGGPQPWGVSRGLLQQTTAAACGGKRGASFIERCSAADACIIYRRLGCRQLLGRKAEAAEAAAAAAAAVAASPDDGWMLLQTVTQRTAAAITCLLLLPLSRQLELQQQRRRQQQQQQEQGSGGGVGGPWLCVSLTTGVSFVFVCVACVCCM